MTLHLSSNDVPKTHKEAPGLEAAQWPEAKQCEFDQLKKHNVAI